MSRELTVALDNALQAQHVRPIILVEVDTSGGVLRVWSGFGDIIHDSNTYTGIGELGGISEIHEGDELGAQGITLTLSGIPTDKVTIAAEQIQHNRIATVYVGALNIDTGALIADPYQLFQGYTDVPSIKDNGSTSTISLTVENKMIDLLRPKTRRYTGEDQKIDFPSDLGFDFVPELQDQQIIWAGHDVSP